MSTNYSTVTATQLLGTGDGVTTEFWGVLSYTPVVPFSIRIKKNDAYVGVDSDEGITGHLLYESKITYSTGSIKLNFIDPPTMGSNISVEHRYDMECDYISKTKEIIVENNIDRVFCKGCGCLKENNKKCIYCGC